MRRGLFVKNSERCKFILSRCPDGVLVCSADIKGRVLDVNPAMCTMLGYTRAEMLKLNIRDINGVQSGEEIVQSLNDLMEHGDSIFETEHTTKQGKNIPVEISSTLTSFGKDSLVLSFVRNISERNLLKTLMKDLHSNIDVLKGLRLESISNE